MAETGTFKENIRHWILYTCFAILFMLFCSNTAAMAYASNESTKDGLYAYLYFYTIDGEEIEELEKRLRVKSDGLSKEYTFSDPNEFRYLPQEDADGELIYSEFYDQVKGVYWEDETNDDSVRRYEAGETVRFSAGEYCFRVKSDNPALTGENLINTPSSQHAYLYFYSSDYDEVEELQKELTERDEFVMPDPSGYVHLDESDDSSGLNGEGIYWACTDQDDERYLFKAGDKCRFKPGDYEFHVVTDDPVTIRFHYPIDIPTYFTNDATPGELYDEMEAVPGESISLKKGLGSIVWGCDFEGWNEANFEDADKVFSGGSSYRIMDNIDLDFFAVYEENDNWDMNAIDENTGLAPEEEEEELFVDVDAINEAAGAGYNAYIDASGKLTRPGGTKINSDTNLSGIPGKIEKEDWQTSLKKGTDSKDPNNYTRDKYGNKWEDSKLEPEMNTVLKQDDSAMYMDVYGNAFIYYSDLSRKDNMSLALERLREGKNDSWVQNVKNWDEEVINRFEAIEFAFLYGKYPEDGQDLFADLDQSVTGGAQMIWKDSYMSEDTYKKLVIYRKIWGGWYDEYTDGLYEKYKGSSGGGNITVSCAGQGNNVLDKMMSLFEITAYAEDSSLSKSGQYNAKKSASLDLDGVSIAPQYYDPTKTYSFGGSYKLNGLTELSKEQRDNLVEIFNGLISMGFTKQAAAGACGNLWQESGFNPKAGSGQYIGIVQWGGSRSEGLRRYAESVGKEWNDLSAQIGYIEYELNQSYLSSMNKALQKYNGQTNIKSVTDVRTACDIWAAAMEGCVCSNDAHTEATCPKVNGKKYQELAKRRDYAEKIFNAMTSSGIDPDQYGCSVPNNNSNNKVPYIPQSGNVPWASMAFGNNGETISGSGCSSASLAMVLTYLNGNGQYIYPHNVVETIRNANGGRNPYYVKGVGASHSIFSGVASLYGYKCSSFSRITEEQLRSFLVAGYPVIMSCDPGEFTGSGHFIVITGIDSDGYYYVNDPNSSHKDLSYKKYTYKFLTTKGQGSGKGWWVLQ